MKAYIKVKKDYNSGLVVGHSQNMQKAISGFNELACEVVPYFSLDDAYSLGAYGLVDYKYAKLLSARWSQLLEREDVFDYRKYQ